MAARSAGAARRAAIVLAGLALVLGLTLLRAADPYVLAMARETVFDAYQQIKPRRAEGLPVAIIDIDEAALARYGQWPWPRARLAELTARLGEMGVAAIAFDMLFAEPDRAGADQDAALREAFARWPVALGVGESPARETGAALPPKAGIAISGADPSAALPGLRGLVAPLPELAAAARGLGAIGLGEDDAGGVVRSLPLVWTVNGETGRHLPALPVEALRLALGVETLVLLGDTGGAGVFEALRIGGLAVPADSAGRLRLYYREMGEETYVSVTRVLEGEAGLEARLAGHIVLVGVSASGLLDIRRTALGTAVPGVSIHAQAIEQMLTGAYLHRADWVGGLEMLAFTVIGAGLVFAVALAGPGPGLAVSLAGAGAGAAASWLAFDIWGVLVDPVFLLGGTILVFSAMGFLRFSVADADRRRIRAAFAPYVAPDVLAEIERRSGGLALGGELRELTVMFADVRNFTALSERHAPHDLLARLNRLFDALAGAITAQRGVIDKFMGDAIMAFWNAPLDLPFHPARAATAALAMRAAVARLNAERDKAGEEPLSVGMGLATGPALVGNVGARERFDYSCIGETVNRAARIEDACKAVRYDILVSEATRAGAEGFATLKAGMLALKGVSGLVAVHILVGGPELARGAEFSRLREAHEALCARLAEGGDGAEELLRCRALADGIEAGLAGFYEAIAARGADFRPEAGRPPRLS